MRTLQTWHNRIKLVKADESLDEDAKSAAVIQEFTNAVTTVDPQKVSSESVGPNLSAFLPLPSAPFRLLPN